jgi:hypothetical protein
MADREPEIFIGPGPAAGPAGGHPPDGGPPEDAGQFVQQPAKIMRIAGMIRELLADVRQSPPDEAGRKRLRTIYERAVAALKETLSEDLQHELESFMLPLEGTPSESEIRVAKAQLVGWLEGLFQGIQAALWAQQMQARAQLHEMRRRGLPGPDMGGPRDPGQYL